MLRRGIVDAIYNKGVAANEFPFFLFSSQSTRGLSAVPCDDVSPVVSEDNKESNVGCHLFVGIVLLITIMCS